MTSIFAQKPIKSYESLTWEQLSEELKKVEKGVKKDRLGCPDPTMAEETIMDKITELMKKKKMKYNEKEEKECKKYTSHIINNWIKKKQ